MVLDLQPVVHLPIGASVANGLQFSYAVPLRGYLILLRTLYPTVSREYSTLYCTPGYHSGF